MTDYSTLAPKTKWSKLPDAFLLRVFGDDPNIIRLGAYRQSQAPDALAAIVTIDLYDPFDATAGHWLHLSISRPKRLPSWGDLVATRDALGYQDRTFVQLVPPKSAWLNVHPHALHLWHRLDAPTVPRVLWDQEGATGDRYEHGE